MHAFRQRPLTWLFFLAATCVAAAAASRDANSTTMSVLLLDQVFLVAGLAAVSRSHRLLRGAMLCIAPLATTLVILPLRSSVSEVRAVLAYMQLLSGVVFAFTFLAAALIRSMNGVDVGANSRWRISLMEMLGWMVVVAIASAATSQAQLPPLEYIHALRGTVASAAIAGVLVALFLTPGPKHDRLSVVIAALLVAAFFAAVWLTEEFDGEDCQLTAALYGVLALGILVVRLDEQTAVAKSSHEVSEPDTPALRIHASALKDE